MSLQTLRTEVLAARRVLGCVSHDLNGTLQALFTYLRLLERKLPANELASLGGALLRLRDEVAGMRDAAGMGIPAKVDLREVVASLRGVEATRLRVVLHGVDAVVEGQAPAFGQALGGLVRAVAASLPESQVVEVVLSAGEHEVRVLVGEVGEPMDTFDPLVVDAGERVGLDTLLAALALETQGGRLLRGGVPGARCFEAVVPRSRS